MKRIEAENILHVGIDYGYFDFEDENEVIWDYEERFYAISKNENLDCFIKSVCNELEKDFSAYEKVKIEAVWCACNFHDEVSDIVFGKYEDETFEESMYNEWYKWIHRK